MERMTDITFTVSSGDRHIIYDIAKRAMGLPWPDFQQPTLLSMEMDITAVHANGCPLRLHQLRAADLSNFAHDIGGIRRHLDRETGQLEGFFVPRYALSQKVSLDN